MSNENESGQKSTVISVDLVKSVSSGIIPELKVEFRKQYPDCPFPDQQLDFLARCAINPQWALSTSEIQLPKGMSVPGGKITIKHPFHPEQLAVSFVQNPEWFWKVLSSIRKNYEVKANSHKIRARMAANMALIEEIEKQWTYPVRLPKAQTIRAVAKAKDISEADAKNARTELGKRLHHIVSKPKKRISNQEA